METVLTRWGNSLGVRIPKTVAAEAGFAAGDAVSIAPGQDGIVIRKARPRRKYSLSELVDGITDENRHAATDWGEPQGREIW